LIGLKRHLTGTAARCADGAEHLTLCSSAAVLTGVAARLASLRLVGEAPFLKEILLASGENEFLSTVLARDRFVLMIQM